MKTKLLTLIIGLCLLSGNFAYAETYTLKEIARAIDRVENSTKYPYGIKSIDTQGDRQKAYKICLNTIRNTYKRWLASGKKENFWLYLNKRYEPLNDNWAYMVCYWVNRYREESKK